MGASRGQGTNIHQGLLFAFSALLYLKMHAGYDDSEGPQKGTKGSKKMPCSCAFCAFLRPFALVKVRLRLRRAEFFAVNPFLLSPITKRVLVRTGRNQ